MKLEDSSLIYLTYDEWERLGFYVFKGEKSHKKDENGTCVFSEEQVDNCDFTDYEEKMMDLTVDGSFFIE